MLYYCDGCLNAAAKLCLNYLCGPFIAPVIRYTEMVATVTVTHTYYIRRQCRAAKAPSFISVSVVSESVSQQALASTCHYTQNGGECVGSGGRSHILSYNTDCGDSGWQETVSQICEV
ncbi:hypothetical protein EB796_023403 [Bugula neritina]|uniref:Uncharacterized protein n=1 Tax=Bugula neritina TaxID=10212 RepID=A0A7J7IXQ0_BUGNE|nr:hypothetical protein EB796_023403 [Bugula neritina]